jgi:hypothetical protein
MKTKVGKYFPLSVWKRRLGTVAHFLNRKRSGVVGAAMALLGAAGTTSLSAGNFPTVPTDEPPQTSFGLFTIQVLNKFQPMMAGTANGGGYQLYYGYGPSSGVFTSPLLYGASGAGAGTTEIGVSAAHCLDPSDPGLNTGANQCSATYPSFTASYSGDPGTPLLNPVYEPPGFPNSGAYNEVFTYMESMGLYAYSNCVYSSSLVPPPAPYSINTPMVVAGALNGVYPTRGRIVSGQLSACSGTAPNYPSLYSDYSSGSPAQSFFQVYVEVRIPGAAGFGTDVGTDIYLTNATPNSISFADGPLIIENTDVESLPPGTLYIHGGALFTVPLHFAAAGHDASGTIAWNAGDTFGTLTLSGHQLGPTCGQSLSQFTNFVNLVLGFPGQSALVPPTLWSFSSNSFPCAGVAYSSLPGINFGGGSMDELVFSNTDYGNIHVRNLVNGGFTNNITPPVGGIMATSINLSSSLSCEVSLDDTNWYSALGSAGSMNLSITNTGTSGKFTLYNTAIVAMTNVLNQTTFPAGAFILKASLTKSSTGRHAVASGGGGNFIASYFDVSYVLEDNGSSTGFPANRSIRLQVSEPRCGVAGQGVYIQRNHSTNILSWASSNYTLQGTTNLTGAVWVDIGTNSPASLGPTNGLCYFRTVCK